MYGGESKRIQRIGLTSHVVEDAVSSPNSVCTYCFLMIFLMEPLISEWGLTSIYLDKKGKRKYD